MDIKLNSENVIAGAEVMGGLATLWAAMVAWGRRQRAKGERQARIEEAVNQHGQRFEEFKGEVIKRLDRIEGMILGSK